jgi:hypothetical protein
MTLARNFITRWIFGEENPPLQNRAARRQQQRELLRRRHPSLTPSTQSQSQAPEPINAMTRFFFGNPPAALSPNRAQRRQQERAQGRSLSSTRRRSLSPSSHTRSSLSPRVAGNGLWSQLSHMFTPLTSPHRQPQTQDLVTPTRRPRLRQRSTLDTQTPTSQRRRAPQPQSQLQHEFQLDRPPPFNLNPRSQDIQGTTSRINLGPRY